MLFCCMSTSSPSCLLCSHRAARFCIPFTLGQILPLVRVIYLLFSILGNTLVANFTQIFNTISLNVGSNISYYISAFYWVSNCSNALTTWSAHNPIKSRMGMQCSETGYWRRYKVGYICTQLPRFQSCLQYDACAKKAFIYLLYFELPCNVHLMMSLKGILDNSYSTIMLWSAIMWYGNVIFSNGNTSGLTW